ncbi:MAG: CMP-N-acetylneuraminic acid synthetase [Loktanella salsilacus]|jgi:CMP-N-acetylneuraminic acid synthetase|uniref:acylneuraminate cytidylyltransferase family protein n=1 Tax=Loktanella salsilacus TaxID=195913 RepID=UPI003989C3BE
MSVPLIALIPLRAGSKGLPGKNIRLLAGKPLYEHTVDQARTAGIGHVVITTDIEELIGADLGRDVCVAPRPASLATDTTSMAEVLRHVLSVDIVGAATVVLLQATSPLRDPADIRRGIDLHLGRQFDLVMSVTRAESGVLKWGKADGDRFLPLSDPEHCFSNRAQLPPVYRPNGAVYVFDAEWFRRTGTLAEGDIGMIETPPERAHDIDSFVDFEVVKTLMKKG